MTGDRVVVWLVMFALVVGALGMCRSSDGPSGPPDDGGGYGCTPQVDC